MAICIILDKFSRLLTKEAHNYAQYILNVTTCTCVQLFMDMHQIFMQVYSCIIHTPKYTLICIDD